jgi:anti-sigma factor RsiW
MMNDSAYQKLIERSWRRRLTSEETAALQAYLRAQPAREEEWELERALNAALKSLPDAPVSSNFTDRVLRATEVEQRRTRKKNTPRWSLKWLPKAALAALIVSASFLAYHQHHVAGRADMARSVAAVSNVAVLPRLEWLEDFEAIHRLSQAPVVDEELVALLE